MKKEYVKPNAEIIDFEIDEPIMDSLINPSWGIGDSEEEDRE